jgi:hypothetical protein
MPAQRSGNPIDANRFSLGDPASRPDRDIERRRIRSHA